MSERIDSNWGRRSVDGGLLSFRGIVGMALLLCCVWLGGLLAFATDLPSRVASPDRVTDAIVVLTGGADRLDVGLQLLADGKARRLLISGVDPATTAAALQARNPREAAAFRCCVDLGHEARDTQGNAIEAELWVKKEGYRSVRLVTGGYHMPRSLLLFRHVMPGVEFVPNPVFPEHVKLQHWWLYPGTARLLAVEYSKYLVSLVQIRLMGRDPA